MRAGIFVGLLLVACEPRLVLGAACARASDCPEGLICALDRCREECATYRDCPVGSTCLLDEESDLRACRTEVEAGCTSTTGCPTGLVCEQGHCAQPCVETAECGGLVCSDSDTSRVCVEPTGDVCVAGPDCSWGICEGTRCDAVRAIAAGAVDTCVLLESGQLECTGQNADFQIVADETVARHTTFTRLVDSFGEAPSFETVSIGASHLCGLAAGEVRCWGSGLFGGTGGPTAATGPFPEPLVALTGVREIAMGTEHSCARRATDVVCWGSDRFGLLGDEMEYPTLPGTDPWRARPQPIELAAPTRDIDTGYYHACAVTLDGEVWCWGANDHGNLGVPDTGERCVTTVLPDAPAACATTPVRATRVGTTAGIPVVQVAVGLGHTCVRGHEGAVYCWGANHSGQIGDGTVIGMDVDVVLGGLVLEGAIDLQAGRDHTCALLGDGRIACWGADYLGELGDGGGGPRTTPVYVAGIDDAVTIAIGDSHGCALHEDGGVSCWGSDAFAQLGDGSEEPMLEREPTPFPASVRTGR